MRRIVNTNRQVVVNGRQDRNVAVAGINMLRGGKLLACLRLFTSLVTKQHEYATAEHSYQPAYQCAHAAASSAAAMSRGASCWRLERPVGSLAFARTT